MLHAFNYTNITYGYFIIRSWDKDQSTQNEMVILIIYRFFKNTMANYRKRAINCLKMLKKLPFLNTRGQTLVSDEYIRI